MMIKNAVFWDVASCGYSSEAYVLTRPTRRHIPEDGILQDRSFFRKFRDGVCKDKGHYACLNIIHLAKPRSVSELYGQR
jgi:hypothetical protein